MSTDKGGEGRATKEGKDGEVTEKGDKTRTDALRRFRCGVISLSDMQF